VNTKFLQRLPSQEQEQQRLAALRRYHILDTAPEQAYEDATLLAVQVCYAPIALVTLVDSDREWFKSKLGITHEELPRYRSFCGQAICEPGTVLIVPDATLDARFDANELVRGESKVRFYAGAPLVTRDGLALGTVCVMDRGVRTLREAQIEGLKAIARQVIAQLEMRILISDLQGRSEVLQRSQRMLRRQQSTLTAANAQLHKDSETDGLTGLFNRRAFDRYLLAAVGEAVSRAEPLTLVMLDVDDFKPFNDEFGHPAGDQVLRTIANILQSSARKNDIVARYGGEEFSILCPGVPEAQAGFMADRLRQAVANHPWEQRPITLSAGVAAHRVCPHSHDALVEAADRALYRAKAEGRNRVSRDSDSVTNSSLPSRLPGQGLTH